MFPKYTDHKVDNLISFKSEQVILTKLKPERCDFILVLGKYIEKISLY